MLDKKSDDLKIYGYDEQLWHKTIREGWASGDIDIVGIAASLQEHKTGNRILDLGCGVGRIAIRLALRGYNVVGIDLSKNCVVEATTLAKKFGVSEITRFIVGDYLKFEAFVDGKFDGVTCILADAWKTSSEIACFFSKLAAYMKPGAVLIIQDTLQESFLHPLFSCPNVQSWYKINGNLLSLHHWSYNPETNTVQSSKEFYTKTPTGFEFLTKITGAS
jgi:2-polyprenyl-3-methyl-5-hydroxy-6-metoxy-1,4-benzoquinol methylase